MAGLVPAIYVFRADRRVSPETTPSRMERRGWPAQGRAWRFEWL